MSHEKESFLHGRRKEIVSEKDIFQAVKYSKVVKAVFQTWGHMPPPPPHPSGFYVTVLQNKRANSIRLINSQWPEL